MVSDELGRFPLPFLQQEIHHDSQRVDQQLVAVDRLLLHHGFSDVEDMAGVHAVNTMQLDIFRRDFEDVLHRLFGSHHFLHQLEKSRILMSILTGGGTCYPLL